MSHLGSDALRAWPGCRYVYTGMVVGRVDDETVLRSGELFEAIEHMRAEAAAARDLVSVGEAAKIVGCHKSNLRRTPGCPTPLADLACGPVWRRDVIAAWATSRAAQRRPGRAHAR